MRRDLEMPRRGRKRSGGPVRQLAIPLSSRLECHGCGTRVPVDEVRPYRCRQGEARDGVDHVLRRVFDATTFKSWNDPGQIFSDLEPNPFRKFRRLFYSYEIARLGGITDSGYVATVNRIDRAVADVDGRGFVATPCKRQPDLARAAGLGPEALWVKDETGNVAGSHKGRHLMGILLWLEIVRALRRPEGTSPLLAIASCGNAALAAGVLARAAARPLEVFVPPGAKKSVTTRLAALGARVTTCPRREQDPPGDPCYHRFVEAWEAGALPFTVQAKRNGLAVEGGSTLVWEMVSVWMGQGHVPDHLVIQVGGGALAAACFEGLKEARALGMIDRLPRLHTVQTAACAPLARAYRRLAERFPGAAAGAAPAEATAALRYAATHRTEFMRPWEGSPHSLAYGILDDETYDWLAVVEGMLETRGVPVVVSEEEIVAAYRLAREHSSIPVEPTGAAGLAGALQLRQSGLIASTDTVAVLFTGVERGE